MTHHAHFSPLNGRTPGGADRAVAVDEDLPPLPPAGDVTVGVVDCGIVLGAGGAPHPWFGDHLYFDRDEDVDELDEAADRLSEADGHGTFVSGVILGQAPRARVIMRRALDKTDVRGAADLDLDDDARVTAAVRSLAGVPGLAVVNLSFGGAVFETEDLATDLGAAIGDLGPDVAVVAAAGNNASEDDVWPASFPGVIGVGAVDEHRWRARGAAPELAPFSNHGALVRAYAAGVQVLGPFVEYEESTNGTALPNPSPPQQFRGWARWSGTSFAAAIVSGRIAQTVIERGGTGRAAADELLGGSQVIDLNGAVWVRSRG